jgi:putative membrane protein
VAAAAFVSPLCALSVALLCAGVGQQLILLLVAAPLLALASPPSRAPGMAIWTSAAAFLLTFWFWHLPFAYDSTFASAWIYWCMQATLMLSAIYLWREIFHHPWERSQDALAAGALTFVHMALLGGLLTVADHPLFKIRAAAHTWNLTALQDQRIGGVLISAPALLLLAFVMVRVLVKFWASPALRVAPNGFAATVVAAQGAVAVDATAGNGQAMPILSNRARAWEHTDSAVKP